MFAKNMFMAFACHQSKVAGQWVAMVVLVAVTLLHGLCPEAGVRAMNYISVCKILILAFIVMCGVLR